MRLQNKFSFSFPKTQALFQTHDQVARKDFLPALPDVPFVVEDDDASVKVVQLIKNTEPLVCIFSTDLYPIYCILEKCF